MNKEEINYLIEHKNFPDSAKEPQLIETHISWVILADNKVYKIKKPFHYSFLDFSTLEQRKFYCEEELRLNRRLAAPMYKRVLPVLKNNKEEIFITNDPSSEVQNGEIVDYTLEMVKMDTALEMDKQLQKDQVSESSILKIAHKIADFHKNTEIVKPSFDLELYKKKFNDINSIKDFVGKNLSQEYVDKIHWTINQSDHFLEQNSDYLEKRVNEGYIRDCHGDLHSKNIFLYDDPVIFDCIEFNKDFRQIDILNEVAFFCMDLEANGANKLSWRFFDEYRSLMPEEAANDELAWHLFTYFKSYRANVRGKVIALKLQEMTGSELKKEVDRIKEMQHYFDLMTQYLEELQV